MLDAGRNKRLSAHNKHKADCFLFLKWSKYNLKPSKSRLKAWEVNISHHNLSKEGENHGMQISNSTHLGWWLRVWSVAMRGWRTGKVLNYFTPFINSMRCLHCSKSQNRSPRCSIRSELTLLYHAQKSHLTFLNAILLWMEIGRLMAFKRFRLIWYNILLTFKRMG